MADSAASTDVGPAGPDWQLHTATTTYAVSLAADRAALVLDYFGPRGDPAPRWMPPSGQPTFATPADLAPLEYAVLGTRHVHRSELIVERADGSRGLALQHTGADLDSGTTTSHLIPRFAGGGLELDQHVLTRADSEVVERWAVVRDVRPAGSAPLRLPRVLSGALNVWAPHGSRLHLLAGSWSSETTPTTVDLRAGVLQLGSRQGVTGHLFAPTMTVEILAADGEPATGAYGIALAWSGSWTMAAEPHPNGLLRVSAGLDDEGTVVLMTPGRELETPHLLLVHASDGPDGVARRWHVHHRAYVSRSTTPEHRPVVYNAWYATGFDVREQHQSLLADIAADLGVEVFVVDDGWFAGRHDDASSLGDWTPDPVAFPRGLAGLADRVVARGLRFGVWVEPEAVSPQSELFRSHPSWVYRVDGQPLTTIRHQLVLDLGQPEVRAWCARMLRELLDSAPITYLKWDMNRPITAPGRPGDPYALEWTIAHTEGYYELLRMLRAEYPHVTVEACSAGGGRVDIAVLGLTDVVWPSDETGPRDRLVIQDGFLRAYPPHVMSSWVTDEPGTRDTASVSLAFRCVVAMAGVMGIGADVTAWDEAARAEVAALVALYKRVRPVLHSGAVHRHGTPAANSYALEYVGPDGRIVVLVWDTGGRGAGPQPAPLRLRLTGVDPHRTYELQGAGSRHGGVALASAGLEVPWAVAPDADVLVLVPVSTSAGAGVGSV